MIVFSHCPFAATVTGPLTITRLFPVTCTCCDPPSSVPMVTVSVNSESGAFA